MRKITDKDIRIIVYSVAKRWKGNWQYEDIVQEGYYAAYKNKHRLEGKEDPFNYMYSIVKFNVLKYVFKKRRVANRNESVFSNFNSIEKGDDESIPEEYLLPSVHAKGDAYIDARDYLKSIPKLHKKILSKWFVEGFTKEELLEFYSSILNTKYWATFEKMFSEYNFKKNNYDI